MTRRVFAKVAGAALVLGATFAAPARAESVPASFDCTKAGRAVETFICSQAMLRWQDLALSRSYRAARNAVAGSARDDLVAGQRDWVRERDRRCIADRRFKELSGPSTELRKRVYDCLKTVYLERRRVLQDLAAAPLSPRDLKEIDLKPIIAARPELVEGGVLRVSDIRLSPDGALAAILLPSLELDGPDQIWLYRVADGRLVPATPTPDRQQPHPDGAPMIIKAMAWRSDTLHVRVAVWSKDAEGEKGINAIYVATVGGSTRLDAAPADVAALLDAEDEPAEVGQDEMTASDGESPQAIRGNRHFLAWIDDRGHGTIELKMRKRAAGSPATVVAWGSRGLWNYLFDADRSQLVHAADTGISVFDMTTHDQRRIAGTSAGDQPSAISADHRLFVWSTRHRCGDELLVEQDDDAPERFCLARLSKPEAGK